MPVRGTLPAPGLGRRARVGAIISSLALLIAGALQLGAETGAAAAVAPSWLAGGERSDRHHHL